MAKQNGMSININTEKMQQIIRSLPNEIDDVLAAIGTEMVADMQTSMGTSPPGRRYGNHVASQPGNPPNPDTGELKASITHTPTGKHERTIHDQVEYGQYLEFGTEFMAARPWMTPVFEDWRQRKYRGFVSRWPLVR